MKIVIFSVGSFLVAFWVVVVFIPIEVQAYTYYTPWWLGNSPSSDPSDSSGDVLLYYTYPLRVQAGEKFLVGVTIANKEDKNVMSNWIAFTNVTVRLRNYIDPYNQTNFAVTDNKSVVIEPGKRYSHSFEMTAPKQEGRYLVFPYWVGWFGPGSTVLKYFEWDMNNYYNATDRTFGVILPSELQPIDVINDLSGIENRSLGIGIDPPYGLIKPVNVTISSEDNQFLSTYQIKGGNRTIDLPRGLTYNIILQDSLNLTEGKIRAVFDGWTDGNLSTMRKITLDNDVGLFALFKTQYYLQVTTDTDHLNYVHGTDWYDSGTEANYFLDPSIDIRSKFDHWEGNIASGADETPSGHLSMDGPKVIVAKWKGDFTYFTGIAGSIAAFFAVGEFLYKRHTIIPILSRFLSRRFNK